MASALKTLKNSRGTRVANYLRMVIHTLRAQIVEGLRNGEPVSGVWLAEKNAMSLRTLQRHLAKSNVSWRTLLKEERIKCAEALLLSSGGVRIREVAQVLGYASSSSMCRAFRGWHGNSPKQLREAMQQPAAVLLETAHG